VFARRAVASSPSDGISSSSSFPTAIATFSFTFINIMGKPTPSYEAAGALEAAKTTPAGQSKQQLRVMDDRTGQTITVASAHPPPVIHSPMAGHESLPWRVSKSVS
jgi:hypothetical protein